MFFSSVCCFYVVVLYLVVCNSISHEMNFLSFDKGYGLLGDNTEVTVEEKEIELWAFLILDFRKYLGEPE